MMPVDSSIVNLGQRERAERIPDAIVRDNKPDVVAFQESVVPELHNIISNGMKKHGYKFETKQITGSGSDFLNGGIVIFSLHPIVKQGQVSFSSVCTGTDCFVAKGVSWATIELQTDKKTFVHVQVAATHLQAWSHHSSIREEQCNIIRQVIDRDLDPKLPIFLVGDLNVDMYSQPRHLHRLLSLTSMTNCCISTNDNTNLFTSDPLTNELVGIDDKEAYATDDFPKGCYETYINTLQCVCCPQQWLDYILLRSLKSEFFEIENQDGSVHVIQLKAMEPFSARISASTVRILNDLSDHYPIVGKYSIMFHSSSSLSSSDSSTSLSLEKPIIIPWYFYVYFGFILLLLVAMFVLSIVLSSISA